MEKSILQKLHEDEEARASFQQILRKLHRLSGPPLSDPDRSLDDLIDESRMELEVKEPFFTEYLDLLINLKRSLETGDDETKIGHWCTRDGEKAVKGMNGWPLYWLTLSLAKGLPIHNTHPPSGIALGYKELDLSLWAAGKDDNTMQKGIRAWIGVHFPAWEIKSLKCVRR